MQLKLKKYHRETEYLEINYSKMILLIIAGVNEISCWKDEKDIKIDKLKDRIQMLENQLNIQ